MIASCRCRWWWRLAAAAAAGGGGGRMHEAAAAAGGGGGVCTAAASISFAAESSPSLSSTSPRSRVYEMSASKSRKRIDMSDMSRLLYVSSITRIPRWVRREVGHRNLRWLTAYVGAIGADAFSNVRRKTRPAGSCPAAHQGCSQSHWRTSLGRVAFGMARTV